MLDLANSIDKTISRMCIDKMWSFAPLTAYCDHNSKREERNIAGFHWSIEWKLIHCVSRSHWTSQTVHLRRIESMIENKYQSHQFEWISILYSVVLIRLRFITSRLTDIGATQKLLIYQESDGPRRVPSNCSSFLSRRLLRCKVM